MGNFERKLQRRKSKSVSKMLYVPVLNIAGNQRMEVPRDFRDNLLTHYGILEGNLTGGDAFHIIFVLEGVVFGILSRDGDRARVTLHILELDDAESINLVGKEIYDFWVGLKDVLTFEELRLRYSGMMGALGLQDVTDAH